MTTSPPATDCGSVRVTVAPETLTAVGMSEPRSEPVTRNEETGGSCDGSSARQKTRLAVAPLT